MEPTTIALVCASVFGVIGILSAFIRQLLLSREKRLNDVAQQKALQQETLELDKIRYEMANYKRFDSHYQVLGSNKDSIQYIDQRIEEILKKKTDLIQRYAESTLRESGAIIAGESGAERKEICDRLKAEIDNELKFYEHELDLLQQRRASLWDNHKELLNYLVAQEKNRNDHLDALYEHHSGLLEKVYLRHTEDAETVAVHTIDAGTSTFRAALMAPIYFLMSVFKISSNIDPEQAKNEQEARKNVLKFELALDENEESPDQTTKSATEKSNKSTNKDIQANVSTAKQESHVRFKTDFSI